MKASLIDVMGSDLTVVNAARVSFDKHHETFETSDEGLIRYLASHNHWSPFGHPQLQFRISAPIFLARQLAKHQVGLVWNEVSRRYVTELAPIYTPSGWRQKAEDKKQGSKKDLILFDGRDDDIVQNAYSSAIHAYYHLIRKGVAPEQARIVLPLASYTEWYWTGSLYAFARICNLRLPEDAQEETREIAKQIAFQIEEKFPISWKYLVRRELYDNTDSADN